MGYYTKHELTIYTQDQDVSEQVYNFIANNVNSGEYIVDHLKYDGEPTKWYDHDDDMLMVSEQFPDVLFELHGEGEENGDLWKTYYMNGRSQHCPAKITYDEFDENKLK